MVPGSVHGIVHNDLSMTLGGGIGVVKSQSSHWGDPIGGFIKDEYCS
jgi:hypothetical protein